MNVLKIFIERGIEFTGKDVEKDMFTKRAMLECTGKLTTPEVGINGNRFIIAELQKQLDEIFGKPS